MIKAIVYDFDGVIADSFSAVYKSYKKITKELNLDFPRSIESFRSLYGKNYLECMRNLKISEKDQYRAKEMFSVFMEETDYLPFSGIDKVLSESTKDFKLYILSASTPNQLNTFLKRHNFYDFFQEIISAIEKKENKAMLLQDLIKRLSIESNELIVIGDRITDYISAKRNMVPDENIILTSYGWGLDRQAIGNANVANSPEEVLGFIKQISKNK